MALGQYWKCCFSVNFCTVEYTVFSKSLKSLCWQRRILMVDIDLTLVLKPLSDVGKNVLSDCKHHWHSCGNSKMNEMSLWLIVFVKIMARGGVKGKAWAWLVSINGRLWYIPVLLNLKEERGWNPEDKVSRADSSGWPVSCLFWEWRVTAVLSMAAGLAVYLHVSVAFGDKKTLVLQKRRYMHPPTSLQLRTANSCG